MYKNYLKEFEETLDISNIFYEKKFNSDIYYDGYHENVEIEIPKDDYSIVFHFRDNILTLINTIL